MYPEKPFFPPALRYVLYLAQHISLNYCLHSNSNAVCTPSPTQTVALCYSFLLPFSLYLVLFKLSTLSFASAVCVCWRGDRPNPWSCSLFPESLQSPLQTSQTVLPCRVITDFSLSLSESRINPGSGKALKGIEGSVWFCYVFHQRHNGRCYQKSTAVACDKAHGCVIPT